MVTFVLSCRVSGILELLYAESHVFRAPSLFQPKFLVISPWNRSVMSGSAKSEHPQPN